LREEGREGEGGGERGKKRGGGRWREGRGKEGKEREEGQVDCWVGVVQSSAGKLLKLLDEIEMAGGREGGSVEDSCNAGN
jgi:hypothetical protein